MASGVFFLVCLALCWCAVGLVPGVHSGALTPCEGVPPSSEAGKERAQDFGYPREHWVSAWGIDGLRCFANAITGVASVSQFSYLVATREEPSGTAPTAHASILGINASNGSEYSALASVAITNIPTQVEQGYVPVVATFPHPLVKLNTSATYLLAFCADANGTRLYNFGSRAATPGSFIYCPSGECGTVSSWSGIEQMNNTMSTNITFTCATPTPAPSPVPSHATSIFSGSVASLFARALLSLVL